MTEKTNGGSAFPSSPGSNGMSLRQWYAGMALQVLKIGGGNFARDYAKMAFEMADAMISEGEK